MLSRSEASAQANKWMIHVNGRWSQANKANNTRSLPKEKEHRPISTLSFSSSFILLANGNTLPPTQFITDLLFRKSSHEGHPSTDIKCGLAKCPLSTLPYKKPNTAIVFFHK
jgi:hypothetical protein